MSIPLPVVALVSPFLADANNGNWRTAHRWQSLLKHNFNTIVQNAWPPAHSPPVDAMIALHALRSAESVRRFRKQYPAKPLIVVLTGTDLYRDLSTNANAQASIAMADALVVLQEDAIEHVPREYRHKTHVIFQSAKSLCPARKAKDKFNCVVVGHLRKEKDPETIFRMVGLIPDKSPVRILHIGAPHDNQIAARAKRIAEAHPSYHWAGAMPHGLARAAIKRAHLLIHPSIIEGGANVIVEAISSGTPVVASRISGNIGMLGRDYPGFFPVGNVEALWSQVSCCTGGSSHFARLKLACAAREKLFLPETERAALCLLLNKQIVRSG